MNATAFPVVSTLPTGTALSRFIMAKGASRGDSMAARLIAERWTNTPQVKAMLEWSTKAAVSPGLTSDATWAGPLAAYGAAGEAIAIERGVEIIGQLMPKMRRVPFKTQVSAETGAGTGGAWVTEGNSAPAKATAYATLAQEVYKAQTIVVLSTELLKLGDPDAEHTVRSTTMAGVAAYLDAQFLTNTVTLVAQSRPAAITNGATAVTSTGSTAAAINADLAAMLALITTSGQGLTWIMRPMTAYKIAATIGGTAAVDIPRTLFGIPMILSLNSPAQITLVDASQILYSDTGGIDISTTDEALLEMNDAPTNPPVAATIMTSLWERNLWAVKVTRWLAYLRVQTGAVTYMVVSY